ncbi:SRPBCC family protein [Streptacidiphilus griseoplanus]|uniref:SRPBCC family protein n=1 Tax=Peterkaempfera griseoplana TaxID=66896 RepID=UPI000A6B84A8|nr:SRPBCC family protein [Peterkaempfera griseoplana]
MSGEAAGMQQMDPVRRLRVLAAGVRGGMFAEGFIDAPPEGVWAVAADLEGELPHLVPSVRSFRLMDDSGSRLRAVAVGPLGHRADFEVVLEYGWCLMQSPLVIGGMAAVAEGSGTRFAVLGGVRTAGLVPVAAVLRAVGAVRIGRMVERVRRRTAARR